MNKRFDKRLLIVCVCAVIAIALGLSMPRGNVSVSIPQAQVPEVSANGSDTLDEQDEVAQELQEQILRQFEVPEEVECLSADGETATEDGSTEAEAPEVFVMPEGIDYEPNIALFMPHEGATTDEVNAELANIEGVVDPHVTEEELASGLVDIELAEGTSVEEVVNALRACSVVENAQPNYVYDSEDLLDGDDEATDDDAIANAEGEQSFTDQAGANAAEELHEQTVVTEDELIDEGTTAEPTEEANANDQPAAPNEGSNDGEEGIVEAEANPNDTYYSNQWGLTSIRALEAWDFIAEASSEASTVTVAVLDMGFDVSHPDLADKLVGAYNAYTPSSQSVKPVVTPSNKYSDTNWNHGTHVAGIITAITNNEQGIAGATQNHVRVMPIMVAGLKDGKSKVTSTSLIRGYQHAIDEQDTYNIRVINMSLGGVDSQIETWLSDLVDDAYSKGIVTVCSAGNEGSSGAYAHYPSDIDKCVAVIALANTNPPTKLSYSNYNMSASDHKDISAPGSSIYSTINTDGNATPYKALNGTSMATPLVSSVVALEFVEAELNADAAYHASLTERSAQTSNDATNILYATTKDLGSAGWDLTYGYGEADAKAAVEAVRGGLTNAQQARINEVVEAQEAEEAARQAQLQQQRNDAAYNSVKYRTHVQTYGWQAWKSAGAMSGTSGQGKRLEAIEIKLQNAPYSGGIEYRTHVQSYGWQGWTANGTMSGTSGQGKRLEAIEIKLTGEMTNHYDVWYRVHAQSYGWLGWTKNGGRAGTATLAKRLEAIEIRVLPKGSAAPGTTSQPYVTRQVSYRTHVQTYGWQNYVYDGATSGTSSQAKRLEGINIKLSDPLYSGGIRYRTHVQTYGWQDWSYDGALSGTSGQAKRLEAIEIALYGEMANRYDVWYRVHAQTFGWMGWAKNGERAGTAGYAKRLEAIQIVVLPKGSASPGSTTDSFRQR